MKVAEMHFGTVLSIASGFLSLSKIIHFVRSFARSSGTRWKRFLSCHRSCCIASRVLAKRFGSACTLLVDPPDGADAHAQSGRDL